MGIEEGHAARTLAETARAHGPWTTHRIQVAEDLWTMDSGHVDEGPRVQRVLHLIGDLLGRPPESLRVLDLGALEGIFSIELARRGAGVLAVEARAGHAARIRAAATALGLENLEVLEANVLELDPEVHGTFDVVLCLGILYHLEAPDVLRFVPRLAELCRALLLLDTHVALTDDAIAAIDATRLTVAPWEPLPHLSPMRTVRDAAGREFQGRVFFEHHECTSEEVRLSSPWASLQHQSFWLEYESLLRLLSAAGFGAAYVPVLPEIFVAPDRRWLAVRR